MVSFDILVDNYNDVAVYEMETTASYEEVVKAVESGKFVDWAVANATVVDSYYQCDFTGNDWLDIFPSPGLHLYYVTEEGEDASALPPIPSLDEGFLCGFLRGGTSVSSLFSL